MGHPRALSLLVATTTLLSCSFSKAQSTVSFPDHTRMQSTLPLASTVSLPEHTGVLLPGGYVIVDPRSAEVAQIAEFVVADMNAKMDAAVHLEIVNAAEKHASGHTSSGYNSQSFSYDVVFTATTTTHATHAHSPSRKASVAERWSKQVTSQYEAVVLKSLQGSLAVSSVVTLASQAPVYLPFEEEVVSYSTGARGDSMRDNDTLTGCSDGDVRESTLKRG